MEENENESGEPENDNSKKVEIIITDSDMTAYLNEKFVVRDLPGENVRKKSAAEMLRDAENHK